MDLETSAVTESTTRARWSCESRLRTQSAILWLNRASRPPDDLSCSSKSSLARAGSTSPRMVAPAVLEAQTANAHQVASSPAPPSRRSTAKSW